MARTRGTWNTKGMWAAGGLTAAVLAMTAVALVNSGGGGDDDQGKGHTPGPSVSRSASPAPTYTVPDDWTEPARWAALPRGSQTDSHGSPVGFPHTVQGAVAMLAAANGTDVEPDRSNVKEQLRIYYSYMGSDGRSSKTAEQIELNAQDTDKSLHQQMGVSPSNDLPAGAYVRSTVVGFKVLKQSPDEVSAWLLTRVATKKGETAKESATYTRSLMGARWQGGDWKLSVGVTVAAQKSGASAPKMGVPGDAAFNSAGWTAIREAS
ncbi:hypothetical protein ACWDCC_42005 [Streptomyces sp. NPDC001102]